MLNARKVRPITDIQKYIICIRMITKLVHEIRLILEFHKLHPFRLCNPYLFVKNGLLNTSSPKIMEPNPKFVSHFWGHILMMLVGIFSMIIRILTDSKTIFEASGCLDCLFTYVVVALVYYLHYIHAPIFAELFNQLILFEERYITSNQSGHQLRKRIVVFRWAIKIFIFGCVFQCLFVTFTGAILNLPWSVVPTIIPEFLESFQFDGQDDFFLLLASNKCFLWVCHLLLNSIVWTPVFQNILTSTTLNILIVTYFINCYLVVSSS